MGWYGMALVDALDYYPSNHPGKDTLIEILQRWSVSILKVQDPKDGLWFDILDAQMTLVIIKKRLLLVCLHLPYLKPFERDISIKHI